ncbi:MAG TPA: hypothetical protein VM074_05575 [Solimonas sp.]|nr:hypothetical protein [Solimonas sp.]
MARARVAIMLVAALLTGVQSQALCAEVVVNAQQAQDAISRSLLRGMFGMRLRAWPDGTPVRVFVLEDTAPLHMDFCKSVLRMYPYQLRQNWDRLVYSGTGQPPIVLPTEEALLNKVAETPGAIGYISGRESALKTDKLRIIDVRE